MLIGGSLAMLVVASFGGMVSNYGWREAQEEEIDAAMRAAISASAHFMRGSIVGEKAKIRERVAAFMRGLMGDLTISKDDLTLVHDPSTNETTLEIAGDVQYAFSNLWGGGNAGGTESLRGKSATVAFDTTQFEFALAVDVSASMGFKPSNWSTTPLDALKVAIRAIAQTVDEVSKTNPGVITVSVVPYANVVNVADTSGDRQTDAKEQYVHMLTGAEYSTQTSRDTEGHWVDTFHHYGTGDNMGPLAMLSLPDFLAGTDWNLHQSGRADISDQAPSVGTWDFEGKDFWNGCVMARWGAYWDSNARPVIWDADDADNWPATKTVPGWAPGSSSLGDLPLHLSDAPPDASDPNTRFTAYSWPDARIAESADYFLNQVMWSIVKPDRSPYLTHRATAENHWNLRAIDRGGSLFCPESSIVPLTDDLTTLQGVDQYEFVPLHSETNSAQTFLHLGIVWALRTLSPLWRDVWNTQSASGDALPRTPCDGGQTVQGCSLLVKKAIVIVSDGSNNFSYTGRGRAFWNLQPATAMTRNPPWYLGPCHQLFMFRSAAPEFVAAWSAEDAATFANQFDVDSTTGVFTPAGLSAVLDGFQAVHPVLSALNPTNPADQATVNLQRAVWKTALTDMTPWQLFRGYDKDSPAKATNAIDVLTDTSNGFGLSGRPVQNGHYCRAMTPFSAYGRADDLVRVGDGPPVSDVAPFSDSSWKWSDQINRLDVTNSNRLDDWFREACDIAGRRGVRIHAIYIGNDNLTSEKKAIALLEECVDRGADGNPQVDEVHVTPTASTLQSAIEEVVAVRRTLRFVNR